MEDKNDEGGPVVSMQDGSHQGNGDTDPRKNNGDLDAKEAVEASASQEQQISISSSGKKASLFLREAWPKSLLDDDGDSKGGRHTLVVCTVDVDNLNGEHDAEYFALWPLYHILVYNATLLLRHEPEHGLTKRNKSWSRWLFLGGERRKGFCRDGATYY